MAKLPPYVRAVQLKGRQRYRAVAVNPADGKRIFSPCFDTPQEAYAAALRMRQVADSGVSGVTFGEASGALVIEIETTRTQGTADWYRDQFRAISKVFPENVPLHEITAQRIEQFVRDRLRDYARKPVFDEDGVLVSPGRRVEPATVNAHLTALRRLFTVAIRKGQFVGENPAARVSKLRADRKPMDYFTEEELQTLMAKVTSQAALDLFTLFAMTGIRLSEASRVLPEHVRGTTLFVRGKRRSRVVPIAEDASAAIRRVAFPLTTKDILRTFREWSRSTGERKLHPHALRHTFGTALARRGERPDVIMSLMGHATLQQTMRYIHESGIENAAAVGRLRLLRPSSAQQGQAADR